MTTNTGAGEAVPEAPMTAFDLEGAIMNAIRMSSIAIRLAERTIGGSPHERREHFNIYHLTTYEVEDLMFAVIQTEAMLETLRAQWDLIP